MKLFFIFTLVMGIDFVNQNPDLSLVRELYQKAAEQETAGKKLLKITQNFDVEDPVLLGYKGAGHMMMAKHVINPFSKMNHFKKGKKIFTEAIAVDPHSPELRFLRFSVQSEAPGFLGYKENMEEDKIILLKEIGTIKDPALQEMISGFLLSSKAVNNSEKERIKQIIN